MPNGRETCADSILMHILLMDEQKYKAKTYMACRLRDLCYTNFDIKRILEMTGVLVDDDYLRVKKRNNTEAATT